MGIQASVEIFGQKCMGGSDPKIAKTWQKRTIFFFQNSIDKFEMAHNLSLRCSSPLMLLHVNFS